MHAWRPKSLVIIGYIKEKKWKKRNQNIQEIIIITITITTASTIAIITPAKAQTGRIKSAEKSWC